MYNIPGIVLSAESKLFIYMLSIKVAEFAVTLVGFIIVGKNEYDNIVSKNRLVGVCLEHFNKSTLKSPAR